MIRIAAFALVSLLLTSCRTPGLPAREIVAPAAHFGLFLESSEAEAKVVALPQSGLNIALGSAPAISSEDVAGVEIVPLELGRALRFQLSPAVARRLAEYARAVGSRRLVLVVDGRALGVRRLDTGDASGAVTFFVEVPEAELPALAATLRASLRGRARVDSR